MTTTETGDHRRAPLARSYDGEPFMVGHEANGWRVRRFRVPGQRGAPELVYGEDASPLEIPIDTPIAEFRELVGNRPGRYRLDAVDVDGVGVPKAAPAYLQIDPPDAARPTAPAAAAAPTDPLLEVVREVLKANAELARTNSQLAQTVIERLPSMIDSAAGLVRAADGAGLPQRMPLEARNAHAAVVEDDQDDDEIDGWPATVARVVDQVVPMLQMVIAHRMAGVAPRNAGETHKPAAPRPRPTTAPENPPTAPAAPATPAAPTAPAAPAASREPMPTPTPDQLVHFAQVQAALAPREAQIARALLAELRPREVEAWLAELSSRSVPDAVALIREHLEATRPKPPPPAPDAPPPATQEPTR